MRPTFPLFVAALISLAGCSGDNGVAPPSVVLRVERGMEQSGEAGAVLDPIVIAIVSLDGTPLPGVTVRTTLPAGGTVTLDNPRSGSDGTITIRWRLAALPGAQTLEIEADGARPLRLVATALVPPAERLPFGIPLAIPLPTYDGSGQVVHPDVAADPLLASRLLMAFTPYPFGNAGFENPSMAVSLDPRIWQVPNGLSNPIVRPTDGYLSDPDLVPPHGDKWSLYYREVTGNSNVILQMQSEDAVHWGAPVEVLRAPSHAVVSPAIVREGHTPSWKMWSVNSGPAGCRAASTTVEIRESSDGRRWGNAVTTELAWPGRIVWHIDVIWNAARGEYWALAATYPAGSSCVTDQLNFARSTDGIRWTRHAEPVLMAGMTEDFRDVVYRSSLQLEPAQNSVVFWLSGARLSGSNYIWRTGALRVTIEQLLSTTGPLLPSPFGSSMADRGGLPLPEDY